MHLSLSHSFTAAAVASILHALSPGRCLMSWMGAAAPPARGFWAGLSHCGAAQDGLKLKASRSLK